MNPLIMGLTTERKVFFGLIVVAGASLILDQTIFSPGSASAGSLDINQIEQMPGELILAGAPEPMITSVTTILNERLKNAGQEQSPAHSGLALQQMFTTIDVTQADPEPRAPDERPLLQTEFVAPAPTVDVPADLPSLSAVMPSRTGQSGAILDTKLYRIGQVTAGGYRLLDVEQRQVLVERNGHEFWIDLPSFDN